MKKITLYTLITSFFLCSCSNDNGTSLPSLTAYNASVVEYFKEIALGFEFGNASEITRRWNSDMKIFVGGTPTPELLAELDKIVSEINDLTTSGMTVEVVSDTLESNYYMHFGSGDSYAKIFPSLSNLIESNWGLFTIFWNAQQELISGYMYVDIVRADPLEQRHLLREELTQSLGLAKDSRTYSESIFQQSFSTKVTEYAQIDRDLIRVLYHPDMKTGLNVISAELTVKRILLDEQRGI